MAEYCAVNAVKLSFFSIFAILHVDTISLTLLLLIYTNLPISLVSVFATRIPAFCKNRQIPRTGGKRHNAKLLLRLTGCEIHLRVAFLRECCEWRICRFFRMVSSRSVSRNKTRNEKGSTYKFPGKDATSRKHRERATCMNWASPASAGRPYW